MASLNGVQLNNTGLDMRTQFMDQGINNLPNAESGMANSLPNNPLYNLLQVVFQGKQTDNISGYNKNDYFIQTGLQPNLDKGDHKIFTQA